jgi:hypothetical protein
VYLGSLDAIYTKLNTRLRRLAYTTLELVRGLTIKERIAAVIAGVMLPLVHFALLSRAQPPKPSKPSEEEMLCCISVALLILVFTSLTWEPFAPNTGFASITTMYKALMSLHRIINSPEAPPVEARMVSAQEKDQSHEFTAMKNALLQSLAGKELESRNSSSVDGQDQQVDPLPTSPCRRFRIDSCLELVDQASDDDYDTEFETESESEDDGTVDLADGMTPTMDDDSDWSEVDA